MDRYTKIVLIVIAAVLVTLVLQQAFSSAQAEGGNCGLTGRVPCAVYLVYRKSSTDWPDCVDEYGKNQCR
jgi:hypothetical protein